MKIFILLLTLLLLRSNCSYSKDSQEEIGVIYNDSLTSGGISTRPTTTGIRIEGNYLYNPERGILIGIGYAIEKRKFILSDSSSHAGKIYLSTFSFPFLKLGYRISSTDKPNLSVEISTFIGHGQLKLNREGSGELLNKKIFSLGGDVRLNYKVYENLDLKFGLMLSKPLVGNFDYEGGHYNSKQFEHELNVILGVGYSFPGFD